jgi:hypothetical protein
MDAITKTGNAISENAENSIKYVLQNPYIMAILKLTLALYSAQIAPSLPDFLKKLLQNTFVKIILIAFIGYLAKFDFQLSIILSIVYVLSVNYVSGRGLFESFTGGLINMEDQGPYFTNQSEYKTLLGEPVKVGNAKLLNSNSDNYSSCNNVTLADLLAAFDNNKLKLQNTVAYAYQELIKQLPKESTAMNNLVIIAKSVGLPGNIEFNDENAKLIATILIQWGFEITPMCTAPYENDMINV